jgi:DNA repair protein RadD
MLRPYQQDAVQAAIAWIKRSTEPALLELSTGSGKSHIAAAIAKWITDNTSKKVLVLQPSKELTEQNYNKWLATGSNASIFSASVGSKCTRHNAVYGTPKTVLNAIERFGDKFGAVIIDECHLITPTIKEIIDKIRAKNPLLRVIGMTATPYRMLDGYIYRIDKSGKTDKALDDNSTVNPYFAALLYKITTRALIDMGFLTPAYTCPSQLHYNTDALTINKMGNFDAKEVELAFTGKGRLTSDIVADVVAKAQNRKGVMLFAATVKHAQEILESLPPDNSMMLGGDINMDKQIRAKLINDFKAQKFKYIVSVGTLTTGFDAPHVDTIAVLRATESASLFQQIIGRGLRLCDGKTDCLVLDYASNIERHELEGDLFTPKITAYRAKESVSIEVSCPLCSAINIFSARQNPDNLDIDAQGYFVDLAGQHITTQLPNGESVAMPAHYGRRCENYLFSRINKGKLERCEHRWAYKTCENCGHENDIAARYCENKKCGFELVNPNEKLSISNKVAIAEPSRPTTEEVLFMQVRPKVSNTGKEMLIVTYTTKTLTFRTYYVFDNSSSFLMQKWEDFVCGVFKMKTQFSIIKNGTAEFMKHHKNEMPDNITFKKNASGYYEVTDYNTKNLI